MFIKTPTSHFFACGACEGFTRSNALDGAKLGARLGSVNLMKIGSIVPPCCSLVEPSDLPAGAMVPAAFAAITSELPGEVISAGVAVAYPAEIGQPAVVMEYSARGHKEDIEAIVRRMAEEALRMRDLQIAQIRSIAVQHKVETIGAAVAAVVLWDTL